MSTRHLCFLIGSLSLLSVLSGCRKDDETIEEPSGKGGKVTLKATPVHHSKIIDSCTIYIKYNTTDYPSDGRFDDSAACVPENGKSVATFTQLKKGRYYLFGRGYDPDIFQGVEGGISYTIADTSGTVSMNVPVTEGH